MISNDFIIHVGGDTLGVSERGFGTILVVSNEVEQEPILIGSMKDLDIETETETYKVVTAILGQKTKTVKVLLVGDKEKDEVELIKEMELAGHDFYGIVSVDYTIQTVKDISKYVSTSKKMFFTLTKEGDFVNELNSGRIAVFGHKNGERVDAAMASEMLSRNIGAMTAKFKTLEGINSMNFDDLTSKRLLKEHVNLYVEKLGLKYITEGTSSNGEFIDIQLAHDFINFRLEEATLKHMVSSDNVDFNNDGIGELVDVSVQVMKTAEEQGIIDEFDVEYKRKSEIPKTELAGRRYNHIHITGIISGAIHGGEISVRLVL